MYQEDQGSTMRVDIRRNGELTRESDASRRSVHALEDALRSETRLLRDLLQALHHQREAIAATDVNAINDSIFVMHRVLLTLAEARRYRSQILELLGVSPILSQGRLSLELVPGVTMAIRELHEELRSLATDVSREVEMNRHILRGIIAAGEELIRVLAGAGPGMSDASTAPGMSSGGSGGAGGILINRTI